MKTIILAMALMALNTVAQAAQEGFGTGNPFGVLVTCDHLQSQKHEITVSVGESVTMKSASNPSTGYRWVSSEGLVSEYYPDAPLLIGSGGIEVFNLPLNKQVNTFTFQYKRSWETKVASTCLLIVKVK